MYYNTLEELKAAYESSQMTEKQLADILNDSEKSNPNNCYRNVEGYFSYHKAKILVAK